MKVGEVSLWIGIVFGALLLAAVIFNYLRHGELKKGGVILALLGFVLLSLSVVSSYSFAFGDIELKIQRIVEKQTRQIAKDTSDLKVEVDSASAEVEHLAMRVKESGDVLAVVEAKTTESREEVAALNERMTHNQTRFDVMAREIETSIEGQRETLSQLNDKVRVLAERPLRLRELRAEDLRLLNQRLNEVR